MYAMNPSLLCDVFPSLSNECWIVPSVRSYDSIRDIQSLLRVISYSEHRAESSVSKKLLTNLYRSVSSKRIENSIPLISLSFIKTDWACFKVSR